MLARRQYGAFLAAWSVTTALDALLDGYAPNLPSLAARAFALGALLALATVLYCAPGGRGDRDVRIVCRGVLLALYAGLALPNVTWRYMAPLDAEVFASLRHMATICLAFGATTLGLVRYWPAVMKIPSPQQGSASR